jgi:hypothetical protein
VFTLMAFFSRHLFSPSLRPTLPILIQVQGSLTNWQK